MNNAVDYEYLYYANSFKNSDMPSHWPAGMARIIIPKNINKDDYIKTCFSTYTVSILTYNMEVIHKVKISKQVIKEIQFPKALNGFGSIVFFIRTKTSTIPFIIASFKADAEYSDTTAETQVNIYKSYGNNIFKFFVDAATGSATFTLRSDTSTTYTLEVLNSQNLATYSINVQGNGKISITNTLFLTIGNRLNITIYNPQQDKNKKTTIDYTLGTGLTYTDEFKNVLSLTTSGFIYSDASKNNLTLDSNGLKFYKETDDAQTIALGDVTVQTLTNINLILIQLATALLAQASADAPVASTLGMEGLTTLVTQLPTIINSLNALDFNPIKSSNSKIN